MKSFRSANRPRWTPSIKLQEAADILLSWERLYLSIHGVVNTLEIFGFFAVWFGILSGVQIRHILVGIGMPPILRQGAKGHRLAGSEDRSNGSLSIVGDRDLVVIEFFLFVICDQKGTLTCAWFPKTVLWATCHSRIDALHGDPESFCGNSLAAGLSQLASSDHA